MIQKPNITLTAKNTGRWMVLSTSASNKKTKVQNEVPFPKLAHSSNNLKAVASGKSLTKSAKDLHTDI